MTDFTTSGHTPTADPVGKAVQLLELMSPDAREQVLSRMDPEHAQRVRDRIATTERPHGQFSEDVMAQRRLLREAAKRVHQQRLESVEQEVHRVQADPTYQSPASADPLTQLRNVHPAALARAMQGERAEAWALVLDRLDDNARRALQMYLDDAARHAIESARTRQASLPAGLRTTIERAIAKTVVPRAMREHHNLLTSQHGAFHGAAL